MKRSPALLRSFGTRGAAIGLSLASIPEPRSQPAGHPFSFLFLSLLSVSLSLSLSLSLHPSSRCCTLPLRARTFFPNAINVLLASSFVLSFVKSGRSIFRHFSDFSKIQQNSEGSICSSLISNVSSRRRIVFVRRSFGLTLTITPYPILSSLPPLSLMSNLQATIFIALLSLSPMFAFEFLRMPREGSKPANEPRKGLAGHRGC